MKTPLALLTCLALGALLAPQALAQAPTMDSLWPNDDGRSWTYQLHFEAFGLDPQVVDKPIRLFFDGTTVAPGGIAAQYLHQQSLGGSSPKTALANLVPDPLLRQVYVARPDLQAKILRAAIDYPCPEDAPADNHALLLGGEFAFRKTTDEIAAWRCNAVNLRAWQWLVSDLTIGNTFTLPLIPDIAQNLFLHGTIAAIEPVSTPAGTYPDCVRVDYVIDYGTSECTDANGNVTGTNHGQTRGFVHYAPNVGPVDSAEEFVLLTACDGQSSGPQSRTSLLLNSAPVPVLPSSWGRLKAVYR